MIFYISDLHLFHNKVISLASRPFDDIGQMHQTIIENWKKTVTQKDIVYILGDVGMFHAKEITNILRDLPGRKALITGNHDIQNIKQSQEFRNCFMEITVYKEILDEGQNVVLFHYPIEEWNGYYRGFYHLYGHVHDKEVPVIWNRFNVCVDTNNYTPRTLDSLIKKRAFEQM